MVRQVDGWMMNEPWMVPLMDGARTGGAMDNWRLWSFSFKTLVYFFFAKKIFVKI